MGVLEDRLECFRFGALGTLEALADEGIMLILGHVDRSDSSVNVDRKVELESPFWSDATLGGVRFRDVGLRQEDLVLGWFNFGEGFDVVLKENLFVVTTLFEGIVTMVVLKEGEGAAMEKVGGCLCCNFVLGMMVQYAEGVADPMVEISQERAVRANLVHVLKCGTDDVGIKSALIGGKDIDGNAHIRELACSAVPALFDSAGTKSDLGNESAGVCLDDV